MLPEIINLGWILDLVSSFGVITLLFALIYKFLPDVEIAWGDVWIGAAVTSLLFTIGKFLIGLYLGNSSVASVYGAAGSLAVLLIWIYYSAQILFFGAEFTQVYAKRRGSRIVLSEEAVAMTAEQRAEQGLAPAGGEEWATAEPGRPLVQRPVPQPPAHLAPAHNPLRRDVRRLKRERWAAVGLGLLAGLMVTRITQK
jgi:membrane protein